MNAQLKKTKQFVIAYEKMQWPTSHEYGAKKFVRQRELNPQRPEHQEGALSTELHTQDMFPHKTV